ncbi:unnamed protein product [Cercospora beticola]|nr:unnamed protein product [Cercospora beticola]
MDHGHRPLGGGTGQRPLPPQRAVSGSHALQQGLKRPAVPSRLNNVRSVSQSGFYVDLTSDAATRQNAAAFTNNGGSLYTSPNVIDLSDDDQARPAKRARTDAHVPPPGEGGVQDPAHRRRPGSPLPPPPVPRLPACMGRSRRPAVDRLARRANGLEPPLCATRLPLPKQVADFAPWNGQHPEDVMTDGVVKGGYYDKPPGPNSTETNSAKPTIWPNLSAKNNMGLQTLSYLFTSVLEKRQALGKCTAPSTFKPPPRVTVTDTKREAWLRDLANPEVPLRKQSRTIPHGIRGKLLMEQCLGKNIAMPRAVWLAKCVGANELRAFRRKGVSGTAAAAGESKWVREWTVQVEFFLESVIAMCGQPEWQSKMDYAVKLATAFYAERLLERDHYLDWIVSSYAQATTERLPIWIILVQLYWKEITSFGRRGRRLAEATLENLQQLTRLDSRVHDSLKARLQKLVMIMAVTNRGCLIIPRSWQKYQHLLTPKTAAPGTPAQNITKRNRRLLAPLMKTPQNTRCPLLTLYGILDAHAHALHVDVGRLATACQAIIPEVDKLIAALLTWSSSVYRTGINRAYLAAKVIAVLASKGLDTDGAILSFLGIPQSVSIVAADVHRVLTELVRENGFSCGRYLQWLITSGAVSGSASPDLATGLLIALPASALPAHLQNTRKSLLHRISEVKDEGSVVSDILGVGIDDSDTASRVRVMQQTESLGAAAKQELADALTAQVEYLVKESILTHRWFCFARDVLEIILDMRALRHLLQMSMTSGDPGILASISDTIDYHRKSFAAMGYLMPMVDDLLEHYRVLRSQQALDRALIISLITLTKPWADKMHLLQSQQILGALPNDLLICEQQTSMAVCSPASDSLVSMQAGSLDSDQEIDAVFASGNTMDEQLMQRVFARIAQRAGKFESEQDHAASKLCAWLTQLRAVDASNFDLLATNHVQACLRSSGDAASSLTLISALVASGCMELETIIGLAQNMKTPASACTMVRLLTATASICVGLGEHEAYRFRVIQQRACQTSADALVPLLVTAMDDNKFPASDPGIITLLLEYTVSRYQVCLRALTSARPSPAFLSNCTKLVTKMLSPSCDEYVSVVGLDAKTIIGLADAISVAQCTMALALLAKKEALRGLPNESTLQPAILDAIVHGSEIWPQLLESAGQDTVRSIYQWAKDQVLVCASLETGPASIDEAKASRNLDILCVAHHAAKDSSKSQIVSSILDRLKELLERLPKEPLGVEHKQYLMALRILLHLCILYACDPTSDREGPRTSRESLLATLCIFLGHPGLQCHQEILEYIHDVASALSDALPAESLTALGHAMLRNGVRDPRLAFILGMINNPDAWLALVSYPQPQPGGGSAQAKALLQRAAQQQQQAQAAGRPGPMSGAGGSAVLQRAMSLRAGQQPQGEPKVVPYTLRRWEMMSDATPSMGDNDTSLSLGLFGARKVY